jgi:hypothetical protein
LVKRYNAYREDTIERPAFEQYIKKHHESWVKFAERYGDVEPVLVTGFDVTKDWAMMAYSNEDTSIDFNLSISIPMLTSAFGSFRVLEGTTGPPHFTYGPQLCVPSSSAQVNDTPSEPTRTGANPEDFNQCVFVRYYTIRKRMGLLKVLKARARPHDLGPGHNDDATFLELTTQQYRMLNHEGDPTSGSEERDRIVEDADSDTNSVVHNIPDAWFPS